MFEKLVERRKNSMTIPTQPWTCSHPIYARTLTEVHQAVRYFLLAIFYVSISIGTLESDSLSLSTPSRTKWTLFIYCFTAQVLNKSCGFDINVSVHVMIIGKRYLYTVTEAVEPVHWIRKVSRVIIILI